MTYDIRRHKNKDYSLRANHENRNWFLSSALGAKVSPGGAKAQRAGATFPYPIYSKWFSEFSADHPGVQINYQSIGTGAGIRQVTAGTVDFGAGDVTDD